MDNQPMKNVKKHSKATVIVTWMNVFVALAMVISLFLPMIYSVDGEAYGLFDFFQTPGFFNDLTGFGNFVAPVILPYLIPIVWAAFPKMWAAVVGIIYALLLIPWSKIFLDAWSTPGYITTGFTLRLVLSVILLVLSIIKLVLIIVEKRQAQLTRP